MLSECVLIRLHMLLRGCNKMNDIVNLIINSSTSVVIIAYFIFRDYKWNQQLIATLTKIETILDEMNSSNKKGVK